MNNQIPPVAQLMQRVNAISQVSAQARQLRQSLQNRSPQQLEQFVRNGCKERGISVEDLARSIGVQIPNGR